MTYAARLASDRWKLVRGASITAGESLGRRGRQPRRGKREQEVAWVPGGTRRMAIFQRGANFLARLPADDNSTAGLRPGDGISFQFRAPTPAVHVPGAVSDSGVGPKI